MEEEINTLKFGKGNSKLDKAIYTFSLPAGWSCPGASICKSKVYITPKGKRTVVDSRGADIRCFAASEEARYKLTYAARQHNFDILRNAKSAAVKASIISASLPRGKNKVMRVHASGDFYSQSYFDAWLIVAKAHPDWKFYAYTKSIPYWVNRINRIPTNLKLTASIGGKHDDLVDRYGLRSARIVFSEEEADYLGLQIDHDDSLAMGDGPSFALLLHGIQPAGSLAAIAKEKLKKKGWNGYAR